MEIGFIGLGNMGAPMAANLAKAGHRVTGFDITSVGVEGVAATASAEDAASGREAVITMLPNGEVLRAVAAQVVASAATGTLFIDCSTVDVDSAVAVHRMAAGSGLPSVDAPVSGGVGGAQAGTLTFMVGGSEDAVTTARPLFEIMGQRAVHCGGPGTGQAAKICNNMILGVSMIAVCEAFVLADRLGLARDRLFDVVSTASGSCWSMNTYCPAPGVGPTSPADNDYRPGFAAELMLKDLGLSQQAAAAAEVATPLGAHATALYEAFVNEGGLGRDFSAILPRLAAMRREG